MRAILRLLSVALLFALPSVAAQQQTTKPVASVKQLHTAMIIPSSDAVFNVGLKAPKNDEEWTVVQNAAVRLAESGNLMMLGARAKDTGAWMRLSRALVDAGGVALKAAEAKNVNGLMNAGDRALIVCESCHVRYKDQGGSVPAR